MNPYKNQRWIHYSVCMILCVTKPALVRWILAVFHHFYVYRMWGGTVSIEEISNLLRIIKEYGYK